MSRNPRHFLEDIVECCEKALAYSAGMSSEQIAADTKTFDAIIRNLEIIGEAVRHIPPDLRDRYPDVPWKNVAGFRDVAIHSYPSINQKTVWDILTNHVPALQR